MSEFDHVRALVAVPQAEDAYARAARAAAFARLRTHTRPRRRLWRHLGGYAAITAIAATVLGLVTTIGGDDSAVARARAGLTLPKQGILMTETRRRVSSGKGARITSETEWQDLANPSNRRSRHLPPASWQLPDSSMYRGVSMRYVRSKNVILIQRVIVSPNAASERVGLLTFGVSVRDTLARAHLRDLGDTVRDHRRLRHLRFVEHSQTCDYLVDPETFRPSVLDCRYVGRDGTTTRETIRVRFLSSSVVGLRVFDLRTAYPQARVRQDPRGIPGQAGRDLSEIAQPIVYPWRVDDPVLRRTDDAALRAQVLAQTAATDRVNRCYWSHGESPGTIGDELHEQLLVVAAICRHFVDDAAAIAQTPAGVELARRCTRAETVSRGVRVGKPALATIERSCTALRRTDP